MITDAVVCFREHFFNFAKNLKPKRKNTPLHQQYNKSAGRTH
jgi:hypothetical protein